MNYLYRSLLVKCNVHQRRFDILREERAQGIIDEWKLNRLTEALMSDLWQTWCLFCRRLLHQSCRGGVCLDMSVVYPRITTSDNSWKRIGFEASRAGLSCSATGHTNFFMRREPTWGDRDKIVSLINALNPQNKSRLLSAFGLPLKDLNHLQSARNAGAHKNVETMKELISQMVLHYNIVTLKNPSDLAWAIKNGTGNFAFYNWLYEIRIIAKNAVQSK